MDIPTPVPGLVIRYAYLWSHEHAAGQEEGRKDRPAAIVVAHRTDEGNEVVVVVPITHTPPTVSDDGIELPQAIKRRLGLDGERSWVVLTETNVFAWPGPDLRPTLPGSNTVVYGELPANLTRTIRDSLLKRIATQSIQQVPRSE